MKKRRPPGPKSISNRSALGSSLGSPFGSPPASPECLTPRWRARYGIGAAALLLGACVDDVDPNTGIMSGAGSAGMSSTVVASAGSAGATPERNTAGSGGGGAGATVDTSDPAFGSGARCPAITQALLTDFTYAGGAVADAGAVGGTDAGAAAAPNPTGVSFGDFTNTLSGSSYVYPNEGAYLVSSDVTGNNWHMTGSIGTYSGFGIVFVGCSVVVLIRHLRWRMRASVRLRSSSSARARRGPPPAGRGRKYAMGAVREEAPPGHKAAGHTRTSAILTTAAARPVGPCLPTRTTSTSRTTVGSARRDVATSQGGPT